MIVKCMLKSVRRNAGLGDPPVPYYNNIPESANALIKRAVGFKESEMTAFCKSMRTLVLQQKEDVDSAVFNTGPYQLASDFLSFEVPQNRWFKMSTKQREYHLQKFREVRMTAVPTEKETTYATNPKERQSSPTANQHSNNLVSESVISAPEEVLKSTSNATNPNELQCSPTANKLSINLVSESVVSAPEEILRSIHRKAEELLSNPHSIVAVPGSTDNRTYIVESKMSAKPHFVSLAKNGKATCEDCPGWKSLKVCSHAVAAAEKSGRLFQYVKWLKEKGPSRMNITSYVTCDSGNGTGKKGGKPSTARRKGGRTGKKPPAKNIVDRPLPAPLAQVTTTIVQPSTPFFQRSSHILKSSTAFVQPSTPVVQPSTPVMQPSTPIMQPSSSFLQPSTPIVQPWTPIVQPPTSHLQPYQPMSSAIFSGANISSPTPQNPEAGIFMVSLLQFCPSSVRSCFGCSQALKPGGTIALPPHDLVITSRMQRQFRSPTGELMHKEGNVYFHVNINCVRRKQPYYDPRRTICPEWLIQHLTVEHQNLLQSFTQSA